MPEVMPSPRPGQRQVAPPLKARRGTVGTLDDAKLAAAKRSAAAAEDGLARLAGKHDDSQQQVIPPFPVFLNLVPIKTYTAMGMSN